MTGLGIGPQLAVLTALGLDEFGGLLGGQFVRGQVLGHRDPLGILAFDLRRHLEVGPVATDAQSHVLADLHRVDLTCVDVAQIVDDLLEPLTVLSLVAEVEAGQPGVAVLFAHGDAVEFGFEIRGERIVDESGEVLFEESDHGERQPARNQGVAAGGHVAAILDDRDRGRIRRGTADAELLELLDQAGLCEARRRCGGVAVGFRLDHGQSLSLFDLRQPRLPGLRVVAGGVGALFVGGEESAEGDDGAAGAEAGVVSAVEIGADLDRRSLSLGVGHLAGHGALPDQVVEAELLTAELLGHLRRSAEGVTGRTDRLVGLLRGLLLARVLTWGLRDEFGTVEFGHLFASGGDRLPGQRRGVRTHIGDVAVLVERLRRAHGLTCAHAQLAAGFLLQGRGGERGRWSAGVGLRLDRGDAQRVLRRTVELRGQ